MKIIKDYLKTFILAISAGICIGIGGTVYLMCQSKLLGAFLFAVGLCAILIVGMCLYTGMVGYLFSNKPIYILKLVTVWCGNFVGTATVALLMRSTRAASAIIAAAESVSAAKLADGPISLFILGIFCGILMFLGVDSFKKYWQTKDFAAIFMPVICVAVFILAGFEHCIADMFYFVAAGKTLECIPALLMITLGNSLGGVIIPLVKRAAEILEQK